MDIENKRSFYTVVLTVSVTAFVTLLNVHSINVSLATIAGELKISEAKVSLIPQAYLIALCSLMLVIGKLADRQNPKRIFTGGLLLFTLTSLLCGVTDNFEVLILWRILQGIGAAVLQAVGTLILIRMVPPGLRGKAFGINGMFASLGLLLGAPLGGVLTSALGWQWAFLLCVPVCILCLIMLIWLPDMEMSDSSAERKSKIDIKGALLSIFSLSLLMYGLNRGADGGWNEPVTVCIFICGVALGCWFLYHLKTGKSPILDSRLFLNRQFAASLIIIFIANLALTGNNFTIPFYLNRYHNLEAGNIGLIFLFFSVAYLIVSPVAGGLADRITANRTIKIGAAVCTVAYGFFLLTMQKESLYPVCMFMLVLGGGLSLLLIAGNVFSFEHISDDKVGEATALYRLVGLLGAVGGVNLFSAMLTVDATDSLAGYRWSYGASMGLSILILLIIFKFKPALKANKQRL